MKTNDKISFLQLALAVLCGAVLAIHRYKAGPHGGAMAMVGMFAAIILILCGIGAEKLRKKLLLKLPVQGKLGYSMLLLSGLAYLAAAVLFLFQRDASAPLRMLTAVFSAFCGIATVLRVAKQDTGHLAATFRLVPIFFLSFFLLMFYRSNGDNPALHLFGYEVAVILLLLLGVYLAAAGRFEKPHPYLRSASCTVALAFAAQELLSIFLMPTVVFNIPGFSAGSAMMLAACSGLVCHGLFYPAEQEVFAPVSGDNDTADEAENEDTSEAED